MAGIYLKLKKIEFETGRVVSYSTPVNAVLDATLLYVPDGTDTVAFPVSSIKSMKLGLTTTHVDTALSAADALFT